MKRSDIDDTRQRCRTVMTAILKRTAAAGPLGPFMGVKVEWSTPKIFSRTSRGLWTDSYCLGLLCSQHLSTVIGGSLTCVIYFENFNWIMQPYNCDDDNNMSAMNSFMRINICLWLRQTNSNNIVIIMLTRRTQICYVTNLSN